MRRDGTNPTQETNGEPLIDVVSTSCSHTSTEQYGEGGEVIEFRLDQIESILAFDPLELMVVLSIALKGVSCILSEGGARVLTRTQVCH